MKGLLFFETYGVAICFTVNDYTIACLRSNQYRDQVLWPTMPEC